MKVEFLGKIDHPVLGVSFAYLISEGEDKIIISTLGGKCINGTIAFQMNPDSDPERISDFGEPVAIDNELLYVFLNDRSGIGLAKVWFDETLNQFRQEILLKSLFGTISGSESLIVPSLKVVFQVCEGTDSYVDRWGT